MATNKLTVEQKRRQLINANKVHIGLKQYFRSCMLPTGTIFVHDYQRLMSHRYPGIEMAYTSVGYYYLISHPIDNILKIGEMSKHEIDGLWHDWILFLKLSRGFKKLWRIDY